MAVKNFVFRQYWIGRKVAGMKKTFLAIFDPTWTHIMNSQKAQIWNSLNSILVKIEINIIINFLALRLTN